MKSCRKRVKAEKREAEPLGGRYKDTGSSYLKKISRDRAAQQ